MDKVKICESIVTIPMWIENQFFDLLVHVVQGNLELLLGQQFLAENLVTIDCAKQKIKYGQGEWIATVVNDRGLLRIPIVPLDSKIVTPNSRNIRKRRKQKEKYCLEVRQL